MSELRLTLKTITPLLMNGADGKPELRTASFRGVFRYWLRALLGATYGEEISNLYEAESRYFGSTKQGSSLNLRAMGDLNTADFVQVWDKRKRQDEMKPPDNVVLPTRLRFEHFTAGQEFTLVLSTHPLMSPNAIFTPQLCGSLLLAFTLGGFGKRSRRGGGKIAIEDVHTKGFSLDNDFMQIIQSLREEEPNKSFGRLFRYVNPSSSVITVPSYPIFSSYTSAVVLGSDFPTSTKALEFVWDMAKKFVHRKVTIIISNKNRTQNAEVDRRWVWGFAGRAKLPDTVDQGWRIPKRIRNPISGREESNIYNDGRRASTVHITVHKYNDRFYPVVTIFRCLPDYDDRHSGEPSSWQLLNNFADGLEATGFHKVYGNRSSWS